ncbi:hypothetical protein PG989_012084 [Apiospora arundinis]
MVKVKNLGVIHLHIWECRVLVLAGSDSSRRSDGIHDESELGRVLLRDPPLHPSPQTGILREESPLHVGTQATETLISSLRSDVTGELRQVHLAGRLGLAAVAAPTHNDDAELEPLKRHLLRRLVVAHLEQRAVEGLGHGFLHGLRGQALRAAVLEPDVVVVLAGEDGGGGGAVANPSGCWGSV